MKAMRTITIDCDMCNKSLGSHQEPVPLVSPGSFRIVGVQAEFDLCHDCADKVKEMIEGYVLQV